MPSRSQTGTRPWPAVLVPVAAAVWGLVFAALLDVLTFLLARYGPSGGDAMPWSFRGNGALIVPFGLGPAVLAGGWTALGLHGRARVRWLAWSVAAGLMGVAVVLVSVAATVLDRLDIADRLTYPDLAWAVVAPSLALALHRRAPRARGIRHLVAGILFALALVGGFLFFEQLLSPGS